MVSTSVLSVVASSTLVAFMTIFAWDVTAVGIVEPTEDGDTGESGYGDGRKASRWLEDNRIALGGVGRCGFRGPRRTGVKMASPAGFA